MKIKTILWIAVPKLAILGMVGFFIKFNGEAAGQLKRAQLLRAGAATPVELSSVKSATIEDVRELTGNIESPFMVKLSAKTAGRVDYKEVRTGDRVTKDQVLIRLDPTELQGVILTSQSNLAEARPFWASQVAGLTGVSMY